MGERNRERERDRDRERKRGGSGGGRGWERNRESNRVREEDSFPGFQEKSLGFINKGIETDSAKRREESSDGEMEERRKTRMVDRGQ